MDTVGTSTRPLNHLVTNDCAITTSSLILFTFQMIIILIVVSTSIYNLTYQVGDTNMWTALLSSSIGYVLPNPKIKLIQKE